jgi:hypothetical protein
LSAMPAKGQYTAKRAFEKGNPINESSLVKKRGSVKDQAARRATALTFCARYGLF